MERGEVLCIFCSSTCDQVSSLNPINEHQARSLGTVLNFESGTGAPIHGPAKFLNKFPCPSCLQWISEAESAVEEWELILDKIRSIRGHFKRIMNGKPIHYWRKRAVPVSQHHGKTEASSMIQESIHHLVETHYVPGPKEPVCSSTTVYTGKDPLGPHTSPSQIVPSGDIDRVKHESLTDSENDMDMEEGPPSDEDWSPFLEIPDLKPHPAILQQGPGQEVWWPPIDDPDDQVRESTEVDKKPRIRLQNKMIRKSKRHACTYTLETKEGPVKLQHFQIQIQRCDEPTFVVPSRPHRHIPSAQLSPRKFHYLETMKRLRQKAQRRHDTSKTGKPRGRPVTYKLIQGKEESCPNPLCHIKSTDPDLLAGHFRDKHLRDPLPYRCREPNCEKAYKEFRRLVAHREAHLGLFRFNCNDCEGKFHRGADLRYHVLTKHTANATKFPCDQCEKSFFTAAALSSHAQGIHGPKQFRCTIVEGCDLSFNTGVRLRHHQRRAHPEKFPDNPLPPRNRDPSMCAECGATFVGKSQFRRHMLKHQGVALEVLKPHACTHEGCRYRASTKSGLRRHIRVIHEIKERTVPCSLPSCKARFKTPQQARAHFKKSHVPKPVDGPVYSCKFCGVTLANKISLRDHIATQHTTGNKADFPCGQCHRAFPTMKYLLRHKKKYPNCEPQEPGPNAAYCELCKKYCSNAAGLKRHNHLVHNTGLKPWKCDHCGKTFPIKMYLMRHERESKTCLGSIAMRNKDLATSSSGDKAGSSTSTPLQPSSAPVAEVIEAKTKMGRGQRGHGKEQQEQQPSQGNSLIQIPFATQPVSEVQQDFYFAFYGIQTSNPQ